MANMERLNHVLEVIEANPDRHDQDHFRKVTHCGTTMCFAGWAVELYGEWLVQESDLDRVTERLSFMTKADRFASESAEEILDLTHDQALALFYDAKSLEDVRLEVKRIGESQ